MLVTAKQMTVGVEVAEGVTAVAVEGMEEVEGMEVTAAVEGTEAAAGEAAAGGGTRARVLQLSEDGAYCERLPRAEETAGGWRGRGGRGRGAGQ